MRNTNDNRPPMSPLGQVIFDIFTAGATIKRNQPYLDCIERSNAFNAALQAVENMPRVVANTDNSRHRVRP